MMKKLTIKSWAIDDRPREKLLKKGVNALSSAELVAILIGSGNKQESAVDLSKRILQSVDHNVSELAKLSLEKLIGFNGIGEAKAVTIITALELAKRRQVASLEKTPKIHSSKDVYRLLAPLLGDKLHEEFWVLYLNNSNKVLCNEMVSKGGLTATIVDVRMLYKRALELSAVAVILCHNHPSGNVHPSKSDLTLTEKVKLAGESLDIILLDHVIITEKSYFSFADSGKI